MAHPHGPDVVVGRVVVIELVCVRHLVVLLELAVILPLLGMYVPVARSVLKPRRPRPVESECDLTPCIEWSKPLLTDVVVHASAVTAYTAAEHKGRCKGPVDEVCVVPVVYRGADYDHRAALGNLCVRGPLPGHLNDRIAAYACVLLLPRRRKALVVVVA